MSSADFDLAITGSGFAGALLAMVARRRGLSVVLLERGAHPRFAIGESSTPLASLLLEELALRYELPGLLPLTKWGAWQRAYPQLGCGLKRGFSFFHHHRDLPWTQSRDHEDQLLVAASPHDEIGDTHWFRADLDEFLVRSAAALGVEYVDHISLHHVATGNGHIDLHGTRQGATRRFRARFLVDATGPRGFLHRALALPEATFPNFPATQSLYAHFTGVGRFADLVALGAVPPFPVDDAALHHTFDGGWIWVLRFNNGFTSAGVACNQPFGRELRLAEGASAWNRLIERFPSLHECFRQACPATPLVHVPRLSFRSGKITGDRWALLSSSAGFVDPLLSTGIPLALLAIGRLGTIFAEDWKTGRFPSAIDDYARETEAELLATARLVGALYRRLDDFSAFRALTSLYFASASFSETARRLGRASLAKGFLLHGDARFSVPVESLCSSRVRGEALIDEVERCIAPFDVAGLSDRSRHHWHPVQAADLRSAAAKLQATPGEIDSLLDRCGFRRDECTQR